MKFDPQRSWREAISLFDRGRYKEAHKILKELIKINNRHPQLLHLLGICEFRLGDLATGLSLVRQAVAIAPAMAPTLNDLGNLLVENGETEAALDAYQRAAVADPNNLQAIVNLARLQVLNTRPDIALEILDAALSRHSENLLLRWVRSLILLSLQDFLSGWQDYAVRWQLPPTQFDSPRYDFGLQPVSVRPENIPNAPIWLWKEQGPGDEILYASVIQAALQRDWSLHLGCSERLVTLFRRSFPTLRIDAVESITPSDLAGTKYQMPLADLASVFRQTPADFGDGKAFLKPDPTLRDAFRQRYRLQTAGRPLVGLSWRSNNRFSASAKSPPLQAFAPLLRDLNCTFINLQYGASNADLEALRHTGATILHDETVDPLGDLDHFAAQVAALDAVVTVSNTTAHVAGGLGIPTVVLLPAHTGLLWYWFHGTDRSLWYASLRLVRQSRLGDWAAPIAAAAICLNELLAAK
ncbi:MAG: tetratricopeptide repeat protein [Ferrovibrio sp.]